MSSEIKSTHSSEQQSYVTLEALNDMHADINEQLDELASNTRKFKNVFYITLGAIGGYILGKGSFYLFYFLLGG